MTLQEKVNLITQDFLERDGDRFVKVKRTGRLGWEDVLPVNGEYSSAITQVVNKEELITKSYEIATSMITVMDSPKKIKINIDPNARTSNFNGEVINVSTKVFDDEGLNNGQKLDVFIGHTIHEGCHLLYTNMSAPRSNNPLCNALENIIEDERIERVVSDEKPGLANFLGVAKYYSFEKNHNPEEQLAQKDHIRLINAICAYIRYPKSLNPADVEKFADELLEVRKILSSWPTSTIEAIEAAKNIYELFQKYLKEEEKKKESKGGSSNKSKESESGGQSSQNEEREEEKGQRRGSDEDQESQSQGQNSQQAEKEAGEAAQEFCSQDNSSGLGESDASELLKNSSVSCKVCMGEAKRGINKDCLIEKCEPNQRKYEDSLSRVKKYIPAVAKSLAIDGTELQFVVNGVRNGRFDTNKLAEAYQNVETVYKRQGEVKVNKLAVCILVDESGSMWGQGEEAARDTAILLNEALSRVKNVDLYIYGHTASSRGSTTLYTYKEGGKCDKYALGGTDSRAGNHDSVAIREAAARVRKHTQEKCLFFVISDGAPNESTDLVRKAVDDVTRNNFDVLAISIDPFYEPSSMYKNNIIFSNLSSLAIDLAKVVKKSIKSNSNRTIRV